MYFFLKVDIFYTFLGPSKYANKKYETTNSENPGHFYQLQTPHERNIFDRERQRIQQHTVSRTTLLKSRLIHDWY